jgi:hypothetical protein
MEAMRRRTFCQEVEKTWHASPPKALDSQKSHYESLLEHAIFHEVPPMSARRLCRECICEWRCQYIKEYRIMNERDDDNVIVIVIVMGDSKVPLQLP